MSINVDISDCLNRLTEINQKVIQGTRLYAETAGAKLEAYAKANAPWKDITGISRQTISHSVESAGANQRIILHGGVSAHFPFLELAHEKRWAIINPTMIKMAPGIIVGWHKCLF